MTKYPSSHESTDSNTNQELSTYEYIKYMKKNIYKKEVPDAFKEKRWKGQSLEENKFHFNTLQGSSSDESDSGRTTFTRKHYLERIKNDLVYNLMKYDHYHLDDNNKKEKNNINDNQDDILSQAIDKCIMWNSEYKEHINSYLRAGLPYRDFEAARKYFGWLEKYSPSARNPNNFSLPFVKSFRSIKNSFKTDVPSDNVSSSGGTKKFRRGGTKKRKRKRKNTLKNRLKYRHF